MNLPSGWTEVVSKSRNGKKYYFNKKTKEKLWKLPESVNEVRHQRAESTTSRFSTTKNVNNVSKTPAQDRLKRLQNQLQKDVSIKKSSTSKSSWATSTPKNLESTHGTKENITDCTLNLNNAAPKPLPSTTDSSKGKVQKPLKRKLSTDDCVVSKKKIISENIATKASAAIPLDAFDVKRTPKNNDLCGNTYEKSSNPFMYASSTSSNFTIPSRTKKVSANCRLQLLRNSLQKSIKKIPSINETQTKPSPYNFSQCQSYALNKSSTSTSCNSDTLLSNDSGFDFEAEKMDWDEIESSEQKQDDEYVSYAHIIKHNLGMLMTKPNNESSNLNTDAFYIVIDTNIFLHNLAFLSSLIELGLSEKTTVLYVPYSVLQELDKIKSHKSDPISQNAQRAVRFINEKLKESNPSVKGQSAIEDRAKLIDIKCSDDNILNCCLQLKNHVKNVLLLSNDVNLRNKALCNQISVSTKSDLETLPT